MLVLSNHKRACQECRRRKRKCEGVPCKLCISNNIECSLSSEIIPWAHSIPQENSLTVQFELTKYFEMVSKNTIMIMISENFESLTNAKSPSQIFCKYAMCAFTSRSCGDSMNEFKLMNDARKLSTVLYEDLSYEAIAGFAFMALYWMARDKGLGKQFAAIGYNLYTRLSKLKQVSLGMKFVFHMYTTLLNSDLSSQSRLDKFLTIDVNGENDKFNLEVTIQRLRAKVFNFGVSPFVCPNRFIFRKDVAAMLHFHVKLTETQKIDILSEVENARTLYSNGRRGGILAIDYIELFVLIHCESPQVALPLAISFAERLFISTFMAQMPYEVENLLTVAIYLYENNQISLSQKLYEIATTLHYRIFPSSSILSCPSLISFSIQQAISNSPSPYYFSLSPAAADSACSNLVSLLQNFEINNNNCNNCNNSNNNNNNNNNCNNNNCNNNINNNNFYPLLSLHGMVILRKTFSSLSPPFICNYQLFPLAHYESNLLYSPQSLLTAIK